MNAAKMLSKLERIEVNGKVARDLRQLIKDERQVLHVLVRRGDAAGIAEQLYECERVLEVWKGHY